MLRCSHRNETITLDRFMLEQDDLQPEVLVQIFRPERRTAPRFLCVCEALSGLLTARQAKVLVKVQNISQRGIGLVSPRRFEQGTLLHMEVQDSDPVLPVLLVGKVMSVTAQPSGDWLLGCQLVRRLSELETRTLTQYEPVAGKNSPKDSEGL
jgi:hypothetical protein